jgi:mono/diheme cytochrome c family protein
MKVKSIQGRLLAAPLILASSMAWHAQVGAQEGHTWVGGVGDILAESCMNCHRANTVAPMAFTSYEEAHLWAPLIKAVVVEGVMPPWHADPEKSAKFGNDRRLSKEQVEAVVAWADAGAPRGEGEWLAPDLPQSEWLLEAELGPPDFIWRFDEPFEVPAVGADVYTDVVVRTTHDRDIWVQAAEVRGNANVVHHSSARVIRPDGSPDPSGRLAAYTPGKQYDRFPAGSGKLIPAGSEILFGMHYNAAGRIEYDQHAVAVWLVDEGPVEYQIYSRAAADPALSIPPHEPNYRSEAEYVFERDAEITLMKPHMHWRGKDMLYRVVFPDGTKKDLLFVPQYDMNWQISYELAEPLPVPAGSRLEVVAHFDNSAANPWNPDPTLRVVWGEDSRDEMMEGWFDYRVRLDEPAMFTHKE